MAVKLQPTPTLLTTSITLPASKSESNRALIIKALSNIKPQLYNISNARDTQTMLRLLASKAYTLDVLDAGTTMRFLTAYCAVTNREACITGTPRMQERPLGILVEALQQLGANISYQQNEGYPPVLISSGFTQKATQLTIPSNISSQYISALLLIAPALPKGLVLKLDGHVSSRPYIQMTLALMQYFGARYTWQNSTIQVEAGGYTLKQEYTIESDWSASSYWFSMVALAEQAEIELPYLKKDSLQGDIAIVGIMEKLGVKTQWSHDGITISKSTLPTEKLVQDFTDCPDLAQTVAVCCAALNVAGEFTGLQSLRIKETDRIAALQQELAKIGAALTQEPDNRWILTPASSLPSKVEVSTYDDHRMAMAFAPLATKMEVTIEEEGVVAKSYPDFWDDLKRCGFSALTF